MAEVVVSGGRLAVHELAAAAADAPVVLAVHGITGTSHAWVTVARALAGHARLLAVDLRGRGQSRELPGPFGLRAHGEDLLAVLDQLELERVVLAGHSLGAFIVARFGVEHPDRIERVVLVDGGLPVPGSEDAEPQAFLEAFLGPTLARLAMRFESAAEYHAWWRAHPAIAGTDVGEHDLASFADYDLVPAPDGLRSSVTEESVRGDAEDLFAEPAWAEELTVQTTLLCAPLGLRGEPSPMQPLELAQAWAAGSPGRRRAELVPGVNHYTITLGSSGAQTVARELARAPDRARS